MRRGRVKFCQRMVKFCHGGLGLWRILAACCALAAAWLAQPAMAQHGPLSLRLESSVNWDANVFRRPDSAADPQLDRGIGGKSDRYSRTSVGLNFDKTWSQQRIVFDAGQTATRYDKFSSLDRDAFNYRGLWAR